MGSFRTNDRGGFRGRSGGSRFGGGGGFGGQDSGRFERRPLEMHDATCDKCKKQCQVPFRPSGDKPVLCSDCFRNEGPRDRGRSFSPRSFSPRPSSSGMSSEQLTKINAKLDKIINILSTLEIASDEDEGDDLTDDLEENEEEPEKDAKTEAVEDSDDDEDEDSEEEPKTE